MGSFSCIQDSASLASAKYCWASRESSRSCFRCPTLSWYHKREVRWLGVRSLSYHGIREDHWLLICLTTYAQKDDAYYHLSHFIKFTTHTIMCMLPGIIVNTSLKIFFCFVWILISTVMQFWRRKQWALHNFSLSSIPKRGRTFGRKLARIYSTLQFIWMLWAITAP